MKIKPEQELELATALLAMSEDPLAFVYYVYPWGQQGTPLEQHWPRRWHIDCLQDIQRHVQREKFLYDNGLDLTDVYREVNRSGRGSGKTALFGWLAHWQASTHLGSTTIVTANTESQLRSKTFPEFHKWFTLALNSHWWELDSMRITPKDWLKKLVREQMKIDSSYWYIEGVNWSQENPEAFAGAHNAYGLQILFDEASGIPEPIWRVTNGFFTERTPYRLWLAVSQGRRNTGAFYNRHMKSEFEGTWKRRHIDIRCVPEVDQSTVQAILDEYGEDSDTARVEVYGEFPEMGESQFIAASVAQEAQKRKVDAFDDNMPLIMGVDPAPRGRTVIRWRQGRDARSIPPTVLKEKDNEAIADEVVRLLNKYDPDAIAVDAGQGTGVIDSLRRRGVKVHEVWFGARPRKDEGPYATLGTELWGEMKEWLRGGCVDGSETLYRDLISREWDWHGREEQRKILKSKKQMAREGIPSPDDADALAVTFYPRVPGRNRRARQGVQRSAAVGLDFNVLD